MTICDELFSLAQTNCQHFTCAPVQTALTSSGGYRCFWAAPPPHWGTMSGNLWEIVFIWIDNVLSKTLSQYSHCYICVICRINRVSLEISFTWIEQLRENITHISMSALLCHMKLVATFLIHCRLWGSINHKPKKRNMIMVLSVDKIPYTL